MRRIGVVALVVGLAAAACGGDPGGDATTTSIPADGTSTTTTGAPTPPIQGPTGFDDDTVVGTTAELAAIREANDHALPLDAALDLFASVYGAIPGGDPTRFESRHGDGSLAIRALGRHWDALTAEQRNAALARLGYGPIQSWRGPVAGPEVAVLQAQVDAMRAQIAAHVGQDVPFPIVAVAAPGLTDEVTGVPVGADAAPERDGVLVVSGSADACRIRFNTEEAVSAYLVAHEVFHCFQYHLAGDVALVIGGADWIVEGSAEWAGATLGPGDLRPAHHFEQWTDFVGSLFAVDYPAVGFFWVIESMGADVWTTVGPMLQAGGGEASVAATGLDPDEVLLRMATSVARRAMAPPIDVDGRWDYSVAVPGSNARFIATLSRADSIDFTVLKMPFSRTHAGVIEAVDGAILEVSASASVGALEFFGKPEFVWAGSFHQHFCLEAGWCQCGDDEGELELVDRNFVVGAGERGGGTVVLSFRVFDPEDAFADGRWEGTITATSLTVAAPDIEVTRHEFTTPFEVMVVDGQVVDGAFSIVAFADGTVPTGAVSAVVTIPGTFTGCGWAPQMLPAVAHIDMTMETAGGPFSIDFEVPMEGEPQFATVWIFDGADPPHRRTGTIDVGEALAFMAAHGLNPSTMSVTFEATRVGDP